MTKEAQDKVEQAIKLLGDSGVPFVLAWTIDGVGSKVAVSSKESGENYVAVVAKAALNAKENGIDKYRTEIALNNVVKQAIGMVYEEGEE